MQRVGVTLLYILWNTTIVIATSIISPPLSLNSSEGSDAVFTCTVTDAQAIIYWTINGTQSGLHKDVESPTLEHPGNNTLLSILIIPSLIQYNQSNIICGAVVNGIVSMSEPVQLLIQGILDPVSNIISELNDYTIVIVKWTPPYSLDNIPITNYTIIITGVLFGYTQSYTTTNNTQYTIQLPSQCEQYELSLSANNNAGNGIDNSIIVYHIKATQILPDTIQAVVYIPLHATNPVAMIMFNITHTCSIPFNHTINIALNNDDTVLSFDNYMTNTSNEIITILLDQLQQNMLYNVDIWDKTAGGISNNVTIEFNSYDVQNVSITVDKEGVLCATCYFLAGSEAGGCVVEFNVFDDDTDYTSVHLSRTAQQNEITGCIKNLIPGRYHIQAFDIEKEGIKLADATPAFIIESITIPELIQPTPSNILTNISSTLQSDTTTPTVATTTNTDRNTAFKANDITYRNSAIGVGVVIILIIIVLIILIIIQLTKLRRRKQLNEGIIAENDGSPQLQTQMSTETTTTMLTSTASNTPSPLIEAMSLDVEAPPPPRPSNQPVLLSQLSNNTNDNDISPRTSDLPSPGTESTTSLLRTERANINQRPSSYHGVSNSTDYRSYESSQQRALNRMKTSSLRSTGVMSAWAAVNPLTLPVLPEAPPPYDEIDRDSNHYHRHSALIMPSQNSSVVSESLHQQHSQPSLQYAKLQFSSANDNVSRTRTHHHSDPPVQLTGNVQYAIISSSNTFISSHNRLSTGSVIDSLV